MSMEESTCRVTTPWMKDEWTAAQSTGMARSVRRSTRRFPSSPRPFGRGCHRGRRRVPTMSRSKSTGSMRPAPRRNRAPLRGRLTPWPRRGPPDVARVAAEARSAAPEPQQEEPPASLRVAAMGEAAVEDPAAGDSATSQQEPGAEGSPSSCPVRVTRRAAVAGGVGSTSRPTSVAGVAGVAAVPVTSMVSPVRPGCSPAARHPLREVVVVAALVRAA